jgi:hypothetical protein
MKKAEQLKNLEEAWNHLHRAWVKVYDCDTSVGKGSPFESIRDDINSVTVKVQELQEELKNEEKPCACDNEESKFYQDHGCCEYCFYL